MQNLMQDLRYAFRQLGKTPGFTAIAIVTLALGIGANTSVFTVMNAVILSFLPVPNPQQLVYLHTTGWPDGASQTGEGETSMNAPQYEQLGAQKAVFSDLMAFVPLGEAKIAVRHGNQPMEVEAVMASGNFFSGLGVEPLRGRFFTRDDETNHTHVAVLSYALWTTHFARDPAAIGQQLFIKSVPFTIAGIAKENFSGVEPGKLTDVWIPLQSSPAFAPWGNTREDGKSFYDSPGWWCIELMGRLAPGVTPAHALAQLTPTFQRAAYEGIGSPKPKEEKPRLFLTDARGLEGLRDQYQRPIVMLSVMVGLVLLIACSNVAMLFIARNTAREREFGVRLAIGAGRGRLFQQLLAESLVVVMAGAALGWLFALWSTSALTSWSAMEVKLAPDRTVLLFTICLSVACGLVFGLAPLWSATRVPLSIVLKTSSATSHNDRGRSRNGKAIVALQMALCLVLLVGAGLLLRSIRNLENHNLGMRTSGLLVFGIDPSRQKYLTDADSLRMYEKLIRRLRLLPGVEGVTLSQNRLGGGWSNNTTAYVDGALPKKNENGMRWNGVGPDYCHVLGIPLLLGRDLTDADSAGAPKVVVVNQTFVQRLIPGGSPLGHSVSWDDNPKSPQFRIVGVAVDSNYTSVRETARPMAYFPDEQLLGIGERHLYVRTRGNPADLIPSVRRVVSQIDPDLTPLKPVSQQDQFEETFSDERMFAQLSMFFGLLAALLVAIGLYGTLSYRVNRRTLEIGVRMAVGASRQTVLWMVLREGMILTGVGVLIGLPIAFVSVRLLQSMLFGLKANDPLTFGGALVGVTLVTLIATVVPARRAASIEPLEALRTE